MKQKVRATVVNTYIYGDLKRDFANLKSAIFNNSNSDIIVFSEVCLSKFKDSKQHDEIINEIAELSRKENIIIVVGIDEIIDNKRYNSAYLFEDGKYRFYNKVHLVFDEVGNYVPGEIFPVFDTKIGKVGLMICYDVIFPEAARCLRLNGAEIICLLAQWTKYENEYWDIVTRVRAKENWVYLLASDDTNEGCGKSRIISPNGEILGSSQKQSPYDAVTIVLDGQILKNLNNTNLKVNWTKLRQPNKYKKISEV